MSDTLIVNLFGGPGTGKSTTAAGIFHLLKSGGMNAELVTEFAKDLTWEQRHGALAVQPYVFGKQLMKLERLMGQVDVIVTDSPILLSAVYASRKYPPEFTTTVVKIFSKMNNLNILLGRKKEYNPGGRNQTEAEAKLIDKKIGRVLKKYNIPFYKELADENAHSLIVCHPIFVDHLSQCGYEVQSDYDK
jgi:ABC-type dipeptide/oligopeptide/nickel transport system ATPase component